MPSQTQGGRPERAEIETWMREQLAIRLHMPANEIDTTQPLAYYGVDSMMSLSLLGDLELWLDRRIDAAKLWEHPTIEALSRHLAGQ